MGDLAIFPSIRPGAYGDILYKLKIKANHCMQHFVKVTLVQGRPQ